MSNDDADIYAWLLRLLLQYSALIDIENACFVDGSISLLLSDSKVREFWLVNEYQGKLWLNKERFELLLAMLTLVAAAKIVTTEEEPTDKLLRLAESAVFLIDSARASGYEIGAYINLLDNA